MEEAGGSTSKSQGSLRSDELTIPLVPKTQLD
jgi:hypothetical protein